MTAAAATSAGKRAGDPHLAKIAEDIRSSQSIIEDTQLERAHHIGQLAARVQDDSRYGDAGVRKLAKLAGISVPVLYRRIQIARAFSNSDIEEVDTLARSSGMILTLSLMETASTISSDAERKRMLRHAIDNRWTASRFRSALAEAKRMAQQSPSADRRATNRAPSGGRPSQVQLVAPPADGEPGDAAPRMSLATAKAEFLAALETACHHATAVAALGGADDPDVSEGWRRALEQISGLFAGVVAESREDPSVE